MSFVKEETPTNTPTDLIRRQDAINCCSCLHPEDCWDEIRKLPSADRPTTDCTKFMEWLKEEVLDEENWELNAVANGEVICRKLKKLGWLDVEDGFYVDTRPTGKWTDNHNGTFTCDQCGCKHSKSNYCPNCGADMRGEEE